MNIGIYLIYEIDISEGEEVWESELVPKGYTLNLETAQIVCEKGMEIAGGKWRDKTDKEGAFVAGWSPMAWGYKLLKELKA